MNNFQKRIAKYNKARNWDQFHNPKDLLLGIVEEVGELRNIMKWEQHPRKIHKILAKNKSEVQDNIGDLYWFLAIIANHAGIDIDEAIDEVIKSNEKRFPVDKSKSPTNNQSLLNYSVKLSTNKPHLKK